MYPESILKIFLVKNFTTILMPILSHKDFLQPYSIITIVFFCPAPFLFLTIDRLGKLSLEWVRIQLKVK